MATVVPFQGLRYARPWIPRLSRLVTPPYDIISPALQKRFYRTDAHNIIRLELGLTRPGDTGERNRYTRARDTLQAWLKERVLALESRPAFYMVQTDFLDPFGAQRHFNGLLCRVKLEPLGAKNIWPHEKTFQGPKLDRLHLLQATGVSFSPVFSLYQDASGRMAGLLQRLTRRRPQADFRDWSGSRQRLWVLTAGSELAAVQKSFRGKPLLIADGHHRYSTALAYCAQSQGRGGSAADYVMMCLADAHDPGLTVLPVYRLVKGVSAAQWRKFRAQVTRWFELEPVRSLRAFSELKDRDDHGRAILGCAGPFSQGPCLLKLKAEVRQQLKAGWLAGLPPLLQQLDVVILDRIILQGLLNIPAGDEGGCIAYTKDPAEAARALANGDIQAAFVPGFPRVEQIWQVARSGLTMPQKSTYFLPKLITGMVMNPVRLESDEAWSLPGPASGPFGAGG